MKKYLILLVALVSVAGHSQISFGARHFNKPADLEKGVLEKFKSSTTIFVLSDIIDKAEYEKILKETWTVTPYKIMSQQEYNLLDMYRENYSFGEIITYKKSKQTKMGSVVSWVYTYLDIGMYDAAEIDKKLPKVKAKKEKKRKSKIKDIFIENKDAIARFYFYPTGEFVNIALKGDEDIIVEEMYTKNVFFNYTPGMLKNYFQKANSLIANGETYAMSGKGFDAEKITSLSTSKLYIPEYVKQKTDAFTAAIDDQDEKKVEKLFRNYEFDYEFISSDDLDAAIASGKEFYYLRYVRVNNEKFVQIVNSKTGEVIFRDYITGMSYNIKDKNLEYLSKTISKSKKKLAK